MLAVKPAVTSSGAVSPMTRAIESMTPVVMPARQVGSTTLRIVSHFGTPRAYEASRSSIGTIFRTSSVERTTIGIISTDRATEPTRPKRAPGPRNSAKSA